MICLAGKGELLRRVSQILTSQQRTFAAVDAACIKRACPTVGRAPGDILISLQWPWRIDPSHFLRPPINCHFSLLPAHRGMYPIAHAILAGDEMGGVTLHEVDEQFDTGPIIAQFAFPIRGLDAQQYYERCVGVAVNMIEHLMPILATGCYPTTPQGVAPTPYHTRESIDFARTDIRPYLDDPVKLDRFVRAMHFPQYQTATLDGHKVVPR